MDGPERNSQLYYSPVEELKSLQFSGPWHGIILGEN